MACGIGNAYNADPYNVLAARPKLNSISVKDADGRSQKNDANFLSLRAAILRKVTWDTARNRPRETAGENPGDEERKRRSTR